MAIEGRCYCGALQYQIEGDAVFQGQCHCRECQYFSGGHPNVVMGVPEAGFSYTKGSPKSFTRSDLEKPVTREFCGDCGTHILGKGAAMPGVFILKVGTLDDQSAYTGPEMAINTVDKQHYHIVPEGIPSFEHMPG